ncbi:glycosyltransferase family 2 protein [Sphingomonas bacterium]|uniref:glycosyltransferase family 2 protein n=1 Tax=Sphingomonas bacterium TaxID=1895847 RepID=UPI0026225503|nr:glycosyltransferase family 2 protein [Sphingomonas bacterium]MDB5677659.1 glycosyltransferase family 2 protein [Sphingomonas bacterium]
MTVTALILSFNEEVHIGRCLDRIAPLADRVIVIDSFSTDRTVEIARDKGAEVHQHAFTNQAAQLQWALDTIAIDSDWIIRVDCDEYLEPALIEALQDKLPTLPAEITAIDLKLKVLFRGKFIRWGGYYRTWLTRLWRPGAGRMEQRWMDERWLITRGRPDRITGGDLVDASLKDIGWWVAKHNGYATRQMVDFIAREHGLVGAADGDLTASAKRGRGLRDRYSRAPLYLRAVLYFLQRYFLRLGFLDGRLGFMWHFMQGFWYFMLIDAKIDEARTWIAANSLEQFPQYLASHGVADSGIAWNR